MCLVRKITEKLLSLKLIPNISLVGSNNRVVVCCFDRINSDYRGVTSFCYHTASSHIFSSLQSQAATNLDGGQPAQVPTCASRTANFIKHYKSSLDSRVETYYSPTRENPAYFRGSPLAFTYFRNSSRNITFYPPVRFSSNDRRKMTAQIISGKEVSDEIRAKLKEKVEKLPVKPKLVIVQVGGREDSNVYIRMKIQFAESINASAELVKLDRDVSEEKLYQEVKRLNEDPTVHGIITQLPFDCTQPIDSDRIVNCIDPKKDVDGLSVYNAGKLLHGELSSNSFIACTPNGCLELIKKSGIKIEGTRSVVIGRSKIVGSPMAQLLLWHNSTVTIAHSRTKNLEQICREADILVAAVGRPLMVKKSWLKPGAVVIDCGINSIPDSTRKSGSRLVGDVDFEECKEVASAITPVPGGVGPMTVAMLIANTVEAAQRASG